MARYQITAPDGRVVTVEGDSMPTEEEAMEIFGSLPDAASAEASQAVPSGVPGVIADRASLMPGGRSTITGMTPDEAQARGEAGGAALDEAVRGAPDTLVETALRMGPPIAAGILTAPAELAPGPGTAAHLSAIAIGAGAGDMLAQGYRNVRGLQDGFSPGSVAASTIMGAVPLARPLTTARGVLPGAVNVAQAATVLGAVGAGGKAAQTLIDEQRLPTLGESAEAAALPAAFGAGATTVGLAGGRIAEGATGLARELNRRIGIFREAGVEPTPGMLNPRALAAGEAARAAVPTKTGEEAAGKIAKAYDQLGGGFNRAAGATEEGATLMKQAAPLVRQVEAHTKALGKLGATAQAAEAKAAKALRDYEQAKAAGMSEALESARTEFAKASDEAFAANFGDVLSNARQLAAARVAPAGPGQLDPATARTLFADHVVKPLEATFRQQSDRLYSAVDSKAPVFRTEPLLQRVNALASEVTGGVPAKLRASIATVRETLADAEGNPLAAVSLDRLRNIRSDLSARVGFGSQLAKGGNEERLIKGVIHEITDQIEQQATTALGEEGGRALLQANRFYAGTRNLFDAPGVEVLRTGNASDNYVKTFIDGMKKSGINSDEYRNLSRVIESIESFNPEVAAAARTHVRDTVRQSVLFEAGQIDPTSTTGALRIDAAKLADTLADLRKVDGTLEALGLGSPKLVAELQTLSRKYPNAGALSGDEWEQLMSSPAFAEASQGGRLATALEPFLAARTVENRLLIAANLEKSGKVLKARQVYDQAIGTVGQARGDVAAAQARYRELLADPVAVAFDNPKLSRDNFNSFSRALFDPRASMLNNQEVGAMKDALLRSGKPANLDLLERLRERYIADRVASFGGAPATGEASARIDVKRLRNFFNPANPAAKTNEIDRARALLSPDQFERLKKFGKAAEEMARYEGYAGTGGMGSNMMHSPRGSIVMGSGEASTAVPMQPSSSTATMATMRGAMNLLRRGKYITASWAVSNPKIVAGYGEGIGSVSDLVKSVGAQRAALLLLREPALRQELEDDGGLAKGVDNYLRQYSK